MNVCGVRRCASHLVCRLLFWKLLLQWKVPDQDVSYFRGCPMQNFGTSTRMQLAHPLRALGDGAAELDEPLRGCRPTFSGVAFAGAPIAERTYPVYGLPSVGRGV